MAVRAVVAGGTATYNARTNFLSPEIPFPVRILTVIVSWDGSRPQDSYRIFTTRSNTPVSEPIAGDPTYINIMDVRTIASTAHTVHFPAYRIKVDDPPIRIGFSYNNTHSSLNREVQCILLYDDEAYL